MLTLAVFTHTHIYTQVIAKVYIYFWILMNIYENNTSLARNSSVI